MKRIPRPKGTRPCFDSHMVVYITGDVNYCMLHLSNNEVRLMARTLKWYADKWPHFLRVHKHTLVNPAYASRIILAPRLRSPSYVVMVNQVRLPIARRRLPLVYQQLDTLHHPGPVEKQESRMIT